MTAGIIEVGGRYEGLGGKYLGGEYFMRIKRIVTAGEVTLSWFILLSSLISSSVFEPFLLTSSINSAARKRK